MSAPRFTQKASVRPGSCRAQSISTVKTQRAKLDEGCCLGGFIISIVFQSRSGSLNVAITKKSVLSRTAGGRKVCLTGHAPGHGHVPGVAQGHRLRL
jgi:hypothetical protein